MPADYFTDIPFRGSSLLTIDILEQLKIYINKDTSRTAPAYSDWLSKTGRQAIKMYPNNVAVRNNVTAVVYYVKRIAKADADLKDVRKKNIMRIDELIDTIGESRKKISEAGAKIILNQSKILTLSYSSNIRDILLKAHRLNRKFTVYCSESRPLNEGTRFLEELTSHGIQCVLITDAGIMGTLQKMNLIITGADRICEDSYINKAGTLALALGASAYKVPFYMAAETGKILKETDFAVRFYPEDPKEVYTGKTRKLKAENFYYESIPLKYVSKIICEDGIFDTQEFKKWYLEG